MTFLYYGRETSHVNQFFTLIVVSPKSKFLDWFLKHSVSVNLCLLSNDFCIS